MKPYRADQKVILQYLESGICVAASGGGVMIKRTSPPAMVLLTSSELSQRLTLDVGKESKPTSLACARSHLAPGHLWRQAHWTQGL